MAERVCIQITERDNVAIAIHDIAKGTEVMPGVVTAEDIPKGGSDAFSGITANPTVGYAADLIVSGGGTVTFSEVTEVRDGVQFIAERCINDEVGKRLVEEMRRRSSGSISLTSMPVRQQWVREPSQNRARNFFRAISIHIYVVECRIQTEGTMI